MDLDNFIKYFPYLYHLTSEENAANIIRDKKLLSANSLIDMSDNVADKDIKTHKRFVHQPIIIKEKKIFLRDQRPISEKALAKCLTDNWKVEDFLFHLNNRVFMWPTIGRLERHFNRYKDEGPVIFRFSTEQMIEANPHVKFCRLNSGATRPNSYLGGIAPPRGKDTFLSAEDFNFPAGAVAEVTFEEYCDLAGAFGIDIVPGGTFSAKTLKMLRS